MLVNITGAEVLGEVALWAAETSMDGTFNITNGDVFRWSHIWPKLAAWFGLDIGESQTIFLDERLTVLAPVWANLVNRESLVEGDARRIAPGAFGDFIFHVQSDAIFNVTKARQAGFSGVNRRSDGVLLAHLEDMRIRRLIP